MTRKAKSFHIRRVVLATAASLLILTASVLSFWAGAREASIIPELGGTVRPAGLTDGETLPVALTGTSARAAVLMEASTGDILFAQNKDARLPMASTTKIMTALVAIEALPLDTPVKIPAGAVGVEGSSIYLVAGEVLTLEELLYALLLQSANDAAAAIAIAVAGDIPSFAARMNKKVEELGLMDTHFVNPHGLDDEEHYTTAYELAAITRAALENPLLAEIVATERATIPMHSGEGVRVLINHNRLLRTYEGCIGVKTGFTKRTGRCLVSAAERDGVRLIAVTLGDGDDWRDHTAMLDYGFEMCEAVTLCEPGHYRAPMPLIGGMDGYVIVENTHLATCVLRRSHGEIRCLVERPRFDYAPVTAGEQVGRLVFYECLPTGEPRIIAEVPLYAAYGVERVTYHWWD